MSVTRSKRKNLEQICAKLAPSEIKKLDKKADGVLLSRSGYVRKIVVEDQKKK